MRLPRARQKARQRLFRFRPGSQTPSVLLRRRAPEMARPFRLWLYPAPVVIAAVGWLFIFSTTGVYVIVFGLGVLALGVLCFLGWSLQVRQWPFGGAVS